MGTKAPTYLEQFPKVAKITALRLELRDLNQEAEGLEDRMKFSSTKPSKLHAIYQERRAIMREIDACAAENAFA